MPGNVTFATHCYEQDWKALLGTGRLQRMIEHNRYAFGERRLIINNVENPAEVLKGAESLVSAGILTSIAEAEKHSREVLDFFGIERKSFRGGYVYSIPHLVNLFLTTTEYLLYFSADCCLDAPATWVEPCLKRMAEDKRIKVAIPLWNGLGAARKEAEEEDKDFFVGYGFSDQCYLVRVSDYRARIYGEYHPASKRYPPYGGELFEKRVDSWMRNHGHRRATYKHASYTHRRFC